MVMVVVKVMVIVEEVKVVVVMVKVLVGLKLGEGALTDEGGCLALGRSWVEENCGELLLGSVERMRRVEEGGGGGGGGWSRVDEVVGWCCRRGSAGKT